MTNASTARGHLRASFLRQVSRAGIEGAWCPRRRSQTNPHVVEIQTNPNEP